MPLLKVNKPHIDQRNLRKFFARSLVAVLCLELSGGPLWIQAVYGNPGQAGQAAGAGADTSVIGASPSFKTLTAAAPAFNYSSIVPSNFDQTMQNACQGTDIAGAVNSLGSALINALTLKGTGGGQASGMSGVLSGMACMQAMSAPGKLQADIVSATTSASAPGSSASIGQSFFSSSVGNSCGITTTSGLEMTPVRCEMFASPQMLEAEIALRKANYQQVICGSQCKVDSIGVIENQVRCLQQQANVLTDLGTNLGNAFQKEFNYARDQNLKFKEDIQNRETQEKNVDLILKGQEGTPGLIKQRDDTLKLVNQDIPQKVAEYQKSLDEFENSKSIIKSAVAQRKMASAMDCLKNNKFPKLRCTPNGPSVSLKDYVSCALETYSTLGSSGGSSSNIVNQGQLFKSIGSSNKDKWLSTFDMIERAAPSDPNAPLEGAGGGRSTGGFAILEPRDLKRIYGSQFEAIKVKQVDVPGLVDGYLNECYRLAKENIDRASKTSSSDIYKAEFTQNQNFKKLQADVQSSLGSYNQLYAQNEFSMTGKSKVIQAEQCSGRDATSQTNCINRSIKNILSTEKSLRQQLTATQMKLNVKGNSKNFDVPCQGLNGCITALNTAKVNIQTDRQNLTTAKSNFNQNEFTKAQNFATGAGQALSKASAVLRARIGAMNNALRGLGVSASIDVTSLKGEPLAPDAETGFKMPRNGLEGIASAVNPPLPDISDPKSLTMPASLGSQREHAQAMMMRARSALSDLENTAARCNSMAAHATRSDLNQQLAGLGQGSCYGTSFCNADNLRNLTSVMDRVNRSYPTSPYMSSGMMGGYQNSYGYSSPMMSPMMPPMMHPGMGYGGMGYGGESGVAGGMYPMGGMGMYPMGGMGTYPMGGMGMYPMGGMYGSSYPPPPLMGGSTASLSTGLSTYCDPPATGPYTERGSASAPAASVGVANQASCSQASSSIINAGRTVDSLPGARGLSSNGGAAVRAR